MQKLVRMCSYSSHAEESTATTGPNGSIEWLNCGVDDVGWNPPVVHVDDLKYVDLDTALQSGNSPFKACSTYVNLFKKHGKANGLPPILLAAFAMQESNCNPSAPTGGLMQITSDKCGEAPNGDCNEPVSCSEPIHGVPELTHDGPFVHQDYNIGTAAKYFKTTLDQQNGDVLLTTGHYNGWFQGMTIVSVPSTSESSILNVFQAKATKIKGSCCKCQQNLD